MPEEILPQVYELSLHDDRDIRAYLFDADRPTLVDAGLPDTADRLLAELEAAPVGPPERVVVTHADPDHVGGVRRLAEAHDPTVHLPEQSSVEHLDDAAVVRYGDGDSVGPFRAVHVPGHQPDNHALVDADAGIVVAGDAVCGADQRGLPAGYPILPPARFSEDLVAAEENLVRLLDLDVEFDALLVFHGSNVLSEARDRLDAFVNFA
ncbi:MAG: MBL fold metallo-hydrolase [Halolamina sp.]